MADPKDELDLAARKFREWNARKAEYAAARAADAEAARKVEHETARETEEGFTRPPWLAIAFTAVLAVALLLLVERMVLAHQVESCMSEHRPNCDQIVDQSVWRWLW